VATADHENVLAKRLKYIPNTPDRQVADEVLQYLGSRTRVNKPRARPTEQKAALQSEFSEYEKQQSEFSEYEKQLREAVRV
jgi:uncharacterized protein involved in exopolysaccharide biosynthesis